MKILVTGSAGFIGSHLVNWLVAMTDWQIVGLDRIDFAGDLSRNAGLPSDRFAFAYHDLRAPIIGSTSRRTLTGGGRFDERGFVHLDVDCDRRGDCVSRRGRRDRRRVLVRADSQ